MVEALVRGGSFRNRAATGSGQPRIVVSLAQRFHLRPILGLVGLLWLIAVMVACGEVGAQEGQEERSVPAKTIEEVLQQHTGSLMAIPGVVGTAQGLCSGEPCIRVFVVEKTDDLVKQIPPEIDGYTVSIEETGEFRKLKPG